MKMGHKKIKNPVRLPPLSPPSLLTSLSVPPHHALPSLTSPASPPGHPWPRCTSLTRRAAPPRRPSTAACGPAAVLHGAAACVHREGASSAARGGRGVLACGVRGQGARRAARSHGPSPHCASAPSRPSPARVVPQPLRSQPLFPCTRGAATPPLPDALPLRVQCCSPSPHLVAPRLPRMQAFREQMPPIEERERNPRER